MMRPLVALTLALTTLCACSAPSDTSVGAAVAPDRAADVIYTDGRIYTVDEAQLWAEAVAIKDGKFVRVGRTSAVEALAGVGTERVDLRGAFVMPGLVDVHTHPSMMMEERAYCALPGTFHEPTEDEIIDKLEGCIARYPKEREWFIAQGFTASVMSPDVLHKKTLDRLLPDRPAYISDESGHSAWVNTVALERADIAADVRDSAEKRYGRDPKTGELTGRLFEGAMNDVTAVIPPSDTAFLKIALTRLLKLGLSRGITAQGDAYVFERHLAAWQELKHDDAIVAHVVLFLKGNLGTAELTPVAQLLRYHEQFDLPGPKAVKLSMGGTIESGTELLIDGYLDPVINPSPIIPPEAFAEYVAELDDAGFQVKVHAAGDGTVRATLDGYEATIRNNGGNRLRHHIDHCSLVHADDFERLVDLDVACTIWPALNAPVGHNLDLIKPMLKAETWARMYPSRDLWDADVRLANHSDAPAAVLWPWWGMEASITRGLPGRPEVAKMGAKHGLSLAASIKAHTLNGAWTLRLDDVTGSIEKGKWADMIVLNHNLFEIERTEIHTTKVQKTLFKGRVVYEAK